MPKSPDPRIELAKTRTMREVLERLDLSGLTRIGREHVGPCPACGGDDRFSVNDTKGVWRCRQCAPKGGDALALVQLALATDFLGAVEWLEGSAPVALDAAELERRRIAKEKADAAAERESARYREYARRRAVEIWRAALPFAGSPASAYMAARGLDLSALPYSFSCLRFLPDHPYVKKIAGQSRELHRGPAMIAAIQGRDGRLSAVHQTWIDPARPGEKARIPAPDGGKPMPSKTVLGSKKGGAIRLTGNACTATLVMGEGIETTATALIAGAARGASYWAGVDLPNMGGKQEGRNSGIPDIAGDPRAFVPPACVDRLIFIQDGDSEPKMTRATLTAGIRRAMAAKPGLRGHIVHPGAGVDLNDLIRG